MSELEALRQRNAAALDLHKPSNDTSMGYLPDGRYGNIGICCVTCGTDGEYGVPWPCPTTLALRGTA